jgi:hypothetical protein
MFLIELGFEYIEGGSLAIFFTASFIIHFISHPLMIILYFAIFTVAVLINLLIIKAE